MKKDKKMTWITLALMAFSTVWGFGNVVNGYMYFGGTQSIFSWVMMFVLYFVPYALIVGELGSTFKNSGSGVTGWVRETIGPKMAYYAGWTYWAVHVTYLASKSSAGLKALSWVVFRNAETYDTFPTIAVQLVTLGVFIAFCFLAMRGVSIVRRLAAVAGTSAFIMSILYVIMMFAAPAINPDGGYITFEFTWEAIIPKFGPQYFTSLSILVFAVGGCEKISPYVNKVKNPSKDFPKGMIALAAMVMVSAILGTIAMSMMFPAVSQDDPEFSSYVSNGAYWAFQKLGNYYHIGDALLIIYAITVAIGQFATLIISIDAPLRMLLGDENARNFVPSRLLKQNKHGAYTNGIFLVMILTGTLILIQSLVPGAANVIQQLTKINSVCMPLRYLWVFVSYIAMRRISGRFESEYKFMKKRIFALIFGGWCFLVTAVFCIMGMYDKDPLTMILNIATPIFLAGLGIILPLIRKREQKSLASGGAQQEEISSK